VSFAGKGGGRGANAGDLGVLTAAGPGPDGGFGRRLGGLPVSSGMKVEWIAKELLSPRLPANSV
jgi:hypothetical protein